MHYWQDSGSNRKSCQRCGTCCVNGGPALHGTDRPLIHEHRLDLGDLITIRLGEPVHSPLVNGIEPSRSELIKISGQNDSWTCRFFDRTSNSCGIYDHRPLECRLLKCWEPSDLTAVIYRECLSRWDVLPADDELLELVRIQDEHCGFARIATLTVEFPAEANKPRPLEEISRIVNLDLKIRQRAIQIRRLSLAEELVFFGRPMFKSLSYYQLACHHGPHGVTVSPAPSLRA